MPSRPWFMGQTWEHLLFAHWRVPAGALERLVPPGLELDRFDGDCWVGVTPFVVRALRLRWTPPVPWLSSFPEVNVRTYVRAEGRPGIYFLSLDADSDLAVRAARRAYRLPYFRSRISTDAADESIRYSATRISSDGPPAQLRTIYRPTGAASTADRGELAHFLTERYCLYTLDDDGGILRAEIHHPPWPLQPAEADIETNTMATGLGLDLDGRPLLHFARRQDVVLWTLEPARSGRP